MNEREKGKVKEVLIEIKKNVAVIRTISLVNIVTLKDIDSRNSCWFGYRQHLVNISRSEELRLQPSKFIHIKMRSKSCGA